MKLTITQSSLIVVNNSLSGQTIEQRVAKIVTTKEPITDTAPIIYTDRREGVKPDYDIRSDRFEFAIDAMDKITASKLAKRAEFYKPADNKPDVPTSEMKPMGI